MTVVTSEALQSWDIGSRLEWLVTNGMGGYAAGSLSGANTRRYHGLLVAAMNPPLGRTVLLSKIEEDLSVEDHVYSLSANKYPNIIYPQGYRHLISFDSDPIPTFTFGVHEGTVHLQKQIWMAYGKNTVYIRYTVLKAPEPVNIKLSPFLAYKDYHSEQRMWDGFMGRTRLTDPSGLLFTAFDGAQPVRIRVLPSEGFGFTPKDTWFFNFEHEREQERGQDASEDLFCPGEFSGVLGAGNAVTFCATIETADPAFPHEALASEMERREQLLRDARLPAGSDPTLQDLVLAADRFVIPKSETVSRATVIAGYPWFTDWGRDTMISLHGLCLSTGRYGTAKEILTSFAEATRDGLIPNRFNDAGDGAEFNTVDATLWLFQAAYSYAQVTGDWGLLTKELYIAFERILAAHIRGTHYCIHVDSEDGLLFAGEHGVQLTWMDARFDDCVVTPRIGKPVEIQALWYNALRIMSDVAARAGKPSKAYLNRANKARKSFLKKFKNSEANALFDVVDGPAGNEAHIRPNQIFALSLAFPILDPASKTAADIIETVQRELLTTRGLRTLSPRDAAYIGRYGPGDQGKRDAAYHQGTVWPWLIGPFVDAFRAVHGPMDLDCILGETSQMLVEYGIGSIAEIYDGDEPHHPAGCFAQAWSVAELLRVLSSR